MSLQDKIAPQAEHSKIISYRDLVVWSRAMDLVEACYKLTKQLPQSEIYGLSSQIRRAAVSVPANIAEGHERRNLGEYLQHLSIANGSLKELETHLLIGGGQEGATSFDDVPGKCQVVLDSPARAISGQCAKAPSLIDCQCATGRRNQDRIQWPRIVEELALARFAAAWFRNDRHSLLPISKGPHALLDRIARASRLPRA